MHWIKRLDDINSILEDTDDRSEPSTLISESCVMNNLSLKLNEVNEFLIFNHMDRNNDTVTTLKIHDEKMNHLIFTEIVPFFNEMKIIYENSNPREIMLLKLKKESRELLRRREHNPITSDLYGSKLSNIYPENNEDQKMNYYEVLNNNIEPYFNDEFDKALSFIKQTKINILAPVNWAFNNNIKDRIALRYFSYNSKKTFLMVNEINNSIKYIYNKYE